MIMKKIFSFFIALFLVVAAFFAIANTYSANNKLLIQIEALATFETQEHWTELDQDYLNRIRCAHSITGYHGDVLTHITYCLTCTGILARESTKLDSTCLP